MLVATDFSEASTHAVGRAGHLPLADGAKVLVTHVLPSRMPAEVGSRALQATARELERVAERLRNMLRAEGSSATVDTHIARGKPVEAILRRARAFGAELIVLGRHGDKPLRNMFLGSTAENVIRGGDLPVLIANRRAPGPYLRPVVAVDADETSKRAASFVPTLMTPGSELTLVHAYDVPLEYAVFPGLTAKEYKHYRQTFKATAERKLKAFAAGARCGRHPVPPGDGERRLTLHRPRVRGRPGRGPAGAGHPGALRCGVRVARQRRDGPHP